MLVLIMAVVGFLLFAQSSLWIEREETERAFSHQRSIARLMWAELDVEARIRREDWLRLRNGEGVAGLQTRIAGSGLLGGPEALWRGVADGGFAHRDPLIARGFEGFWEWEQGSAGIALAVRQAADEPGAHPPGQSLQAVPIRHVRLDRVPGPQRGAVAVIAKRVRHADPARAVSGEVEIESLGPAVVSTGHAYGGRWDSGATSAGVIEEITKGGGALRCSLAASGTAAAYCPYDSGSLPSSVLASSSAALLSAEVARALCTTAAGAEQPDFCASLCAEADPSAVVPAYCS